jgi:hypothetical protein
MAVRLFKPGFGHAKEMVKDGNYVFDERDTWSEHQPSTRCFTGLPERQI